MATTITYVRTDSLDPRIASDVEDVEFFNPLTGDKLEIQLGAANRKHFESHLAKLQKYIDSAEIVEAPAPVKAKPAAKANGELALIREWAKLNGFTVGDRGRIKAEIKDAYYAAQPVKLVESSTEAPEAEQAVSNVVKDVPGVGKVAIITTEPASTEDEIMAAHNSGHLSSDDVLAMLSEIDAEAVDTENVSE